MSFLSRAFTSPRETRNYTPSHIPNWSEESTKCDGDPMTLAAFFACVRILADTVSSLPLKAYRQVGDVSVAVDPQPALLQASPYPGLTTFAWLWMMMRSLAITGNAFGLITARDNNLRPTAIRPIHPDLVQVEPSKSDELKPVYKIAGQRVDFDDIVHIQRFPEAGRFTGLSIIEVAADSYGLSLAAERFGRNFFRDSAIPSGVLTTDGELTAEQQKRNMKEWLRSHRNRRLPALLSGGLKWQSISITPDEAQFISTRSFQRSEIAMWFGIPPHMIGDIEKQTCLPADALVFTEDGPRRIADVRVGDMVWSLGEDQKAFELARVIRSDLTGFDAILRIKTRSRELRANATHRVLVRRKCSAPHDGPGGHRAVEWRNEWIPAGELCEGDYLVALNGLPDGVTDTAPNGRTLTEGFMAFAGLMIGDGTVGKAHISVARHREAPYMDYYREIMQGEFVCAAKGGSLPEAQRPRARIHLREYDRCTEFSSLSAANELRELGLSGVARTKRVPDWVFGLKPDLIRAFLAGIIDSDGSVDKRGWITFSSCNPELLEDIRHLCMSVGIPVGTVRLNKQSGQCVINGRTVNRGDMYQLSGYDVESNRAIEPRHPVKRQRLLEASITSRNNVWSKDYMGRGSKGSRPGETFHIDGGALQRIQSIAVEAPEDVYDLGVEGTHSFIADGLVVHNSYGAGVEQQSISFTTYTLRAWLSCIEQVLSTLLPRGQYAQFNIDGLLRGDNAARWEAYQMAIQNSVVSINEVRAKEDLPPIAGGDVHLQPMNFVPLGYTPPEPQQNTAPVSGAEEGVK